jgi:hypothetical protein
MKESGVTSPILVGADNDVLARHASGGGRNDKQQIDFIPGVGAIGTEEIHGITKL